MRIVLSQTHEGVIGIKLSLESGCTRRSMGKYWFVLVLVSLRSNQVQGVVQIFFPFFLFRLKYVMSKQIKVWGCCVYLSRMSYGIVNVLCRLLCFGRDPTVRVSLVALHSNSI